MWIIFREEEVHVPINEPFFIYIKKTKTCFTMDVWPSRKEKKNETCMNNQPKESPRADS